MIKGIIIGGIKEDNYGLGVLISEKDLVVHMMITKNKIISESLKYSLDVYRNNKIRGIVVNSGNANCFVPDGYRDAEEICNLVASKFNIDPKKLMIFSTGIIGKKIDLKKIRNLVEKINLGDKYDDYLSFANAIRTTDKKVKIVVERFKDAILIVIAKGSGMINPHLSEATMLCFIITNIKNEKLKEIFVDSINRTLNLIAIDNDTSTNDAVVLLTTNEIYVDDDTVKKMFLSSLRTISKKIVEDGEGASKLVEIHVKNAKDYEDAKKVIKSLATSFLFKTMIFGSNPNFGRIIACLGYSGADFDSDKLKIYINDSICIIKDGRILEENLKNVQKELIKKRIKITIDLSNGKEELTGYLCDLSYAYVRINAFEYT